MLFRSLLKIELKDLKLADFDLDLTGFDLPEIEELFAGDEADEIKEGLIDDDEVPDVDKNEYGVERGDVWLLGAYYQCEGCEKEFTYEQGQEMGGECNCE